MEKKKSILLTVITAVTLVVLVIGATYAYFQTAVGTATSADVRVTTYTTDLLTFTTGDEIAITADQSNFADGLGNQTGETFARAHLLANSKKNTATANYYVYLNITNNTFEYTQENETAELLLQVTDPNGVEITTLSGLEYKTVTDGKGETVKGFDVTTLNGLVTIANNYEIVANKEITQTWTIKLVFVNLDADQNANAGHSLSAKLIIQKDAKTTTLADWVKAQYTTQGANNLYYHDSNLENGAGDNSYRYAGASDSVNNFVCFGSDEATCPDDNLYRIIGVFGNRVKLIKWDYATSTLLGTDGDYKDTYQTVSNGNWGTSKGTNAQTAIGAYWWNYDGTKCGTNTWSASELNAVNLNENYLNNIGLTWANKIATTTWKVGGNTFDNVAGTKAATVYANEYTNPAEDTTETAKIGLMYVSDYGFAASPSVWVTNLNSYNSYTNDNWMYMGLNEWTIVRRSEVTDGALRIDGDGTVTSDDVGYSTLASAVRPVFYLDASVNYGSGMGQKSDPVRLS